MKVQFCDWNYEIVYEHFLYYSNCEQILNDHYDEVKNFKFCPYCGKRIKWGLDLTNEEE